MFRQIDAHLGRPDSLIKKVKIAAAKTDRTRPEVSKLFSCTAQLSMKFFLLITVKMPSIVGILTFMSRKKKHSRFIQA